VYLLLEMRVKPEQNAQNLKQSKLYQPAYPLSRKKASGNFIVFPGFPLEKEDIRVECGKEKREDE
jgi:hypothetical protein